MPLPLICLERPAWAVLVRSQNITTNPLWTRFWVTFRPSGRTVKYLRFNLYTFLTQPGEGLSSISGAPATGGSKNQAIGHLERRLRSLPGAWGISKSGCAARAWTIFVPILRMHEQPTYFERPSITFCSSERAVKYCIFSWPTKHGCLNSIWHDRIPEESLPSNTSPSVVCVCVWVGGSLPATWGIPMCASAVRLLAVFVPAPCTRGLSAHFKPEVISHSLQVVGGI